MPGTAFLLQVQQAHFVFSHASQDFNFNMASGFLCRTRPGPQAPAQGCQMMTTASSIQSFCFFPQSAMDCGFGCCAAQNRFLLVLTLNSLFDLTLAFTENGVCRCLKDLPPCETCTVWKHLLKMVGGAEYANGNI